jgi:hypothetical protein
MVIYVLFLTKNVKRKFSVRTVISYEIKIYYIENH